MKERIGKMEKKKRKKRKKETNTTSAAINLYAWGLKF
jgi:hypothetical protein